MTEKNKIEKQRAAIKRSEEKLYAAGSKMTSMQRFDLSMKLSTQRSQLALLLRIKGWSADAALESNQTEEKE